MCSCNSKCQFDKVVEIILAALENFNLRLSDFKLIISDSAKYMIKAGLMLK
jgi:hypothetical protein